MSTVKFSSRVFRVIIMTINNKNEKMTEASASVCVLVTTALESTLREELSIVNQTKKREGRHNLKARWQSTSYMTSEFIN